MEKTTINVPLAAETKADFSRLCDSLGYSPAEAIHMFIRAALQTGDMPFEVVDIPNAETMAAIEEAEAERLNGKCKVFHSFDEFIMRGVKPLTSGMGI